MEDLQVGMELEGTVRNVDRRLSISEQDGLVHIITEIEKGFVKHPSVCRLVVRYHNGLVTELDLKKGRV